MTWHPVPDKAAARVLGAALRGVGYTEAAVVDLLGDDAYSLSPDDAPAAERRLARMPIDIAVRAFFLQLPVTARDAERALGEEALAALETMGLATVRDDLVPRVRILPVGELLVASDNFPGAEEQPNYVAAYTPTSRLCATLTPR